MSEWQEVALGSLTTKIGSGATPTGGENAYKTSGISLIRSQNILDFKFSYNGLAYIDDAQAKKLANVSVGASDILLNITGDSVARCCIVDTQYLPARVNQHVAIIRINPTKADYCFIFYYLQFLKSELLQQSEIGATRRALTKGMIEKLELMIPPFQEQKAIAEVLSSLDDKIDLLHRQNKTLESLAETLFRRWFVEEASEDWSRGNLGEIVEFYYGKGLKESERSGTGFPVVGSNGIVGYHSEYLVEAPGIVIGRKGTLGETNFLKENFYPIDTTYFVKPKKEYGYLFVFFLLRSIDFKEMNSDSAVPGLNRNMALSIELSIPPEARIAKFNTLVHINFEKIHKNKQQIISLEKFRDMLILKLMTGDVRIKG